MSLKDELAPLIEKYGALAVADAVMKVLIRDLPAGRHGALGHGATKMFENARHRRHERIRKHTADDVLLKGRRN